MKTFYHLLEDGIYFDDEHIEGPTIMEESVLQDGKYLRLNIDLSKNNENIEAELIPILKYFKDVFDETSPLSTKTGGRRQKISLYIIEKRRLRNLKL